MGFLLREVVEDPYFWAGFAGWALSRLLAFGHIGFAGQALRAWWPSARSASPVRLRPRGLLENPLFALFQKNA